MTILNSRSREYVAMEGNGTGSVGPKGKPGPIITQTFVGKRDPPDTTPDPPDENEVCGWGPLRPTFFQRFRDPKWVLFWLCWAGGIQGMVVNGFVNVVISNIERRYDLTSTETGTVASCYDIASVLLLIPVSYFGGRGIKPRYLGIGVFVMGLGSIVFTLPHFTAAPYSVSDIGQERTCHIGSNSSVPCDYSNSPQSLSNYKYVFFLGQLLHGAGAAPLYTLGVTYLDENLPLRSSSFYIGIYYALTIIGPAIGYLAGGAFLELYVDIDKVDINSINLSQDSPRFVGAWWIGFIFSALLAFIIAFPIAGFPRQLPGAAKFKVERESEVYHRKSETQERAKNEEGIHVKYILKSIKVLLTNPTFMFLNLAAACEGNLLSGFATFTPKFIEAQFSLTASAAAQYVGYAAIPAGGGGTFIGGYLVKKFDLRVKGIIRLCLGTTSVVLFTALVFLVHCGNVPYAGVNVDYGEHGMDRMKSVPSGNLTADCNQDCGCSPDEYSPVCGIDGIMYYSPCYAGCENRVTGNQKTFANCSCISVPPSMLAESEYMAMSGKCRSTCLYLPLFMSVFGVMMMLTFIASMPALSATLRCVPQEERSLALGIQWIVARCLGSIPGPILFGKMIDITCQLWQNKCEEQGSCFFYDNESMSYNLLTVALVGKVLSTLFFFLALFTYKKTSDNEVKPESNGKVSTLTNGQNHTSSVSTAMTSVSSNDSFRGGFTPNGGSTPTGGLTPQSEDSVFISLPVNGTSNNVLSMPIQAPAKTDW